MSHQHTTQKEQVSLGQVEPSSTVSVVQEIGAGKMPQNETIVASLRDFEAPLGSQSHGTGKEAKIAQHAQSLIQHTREMFQEKNADDTLQNVHSHTKEAGKALAEGTKEGHHQTIGTEKGHWTDERVLELRSLLQAFRKTATALARNNSFRSDLIESVQLFQTLIFDFTQNTIDKKLTQAKQNINQPSSATGSEHSSTTTHPTTPSTTATTGVVPAPTIPPTTAGVVPSSTMTHPTTPTTVSTSPTGMVTSTASVGPTSTTPSSFTVPLSHVGEHSSVHEGEKPKGKIIEHQSTATSTDSSSGSSSSNAPAMSEEERKHAFEKLRKVMVHLGHTPEYKELVEQLTNFIQHNGTQMAAIASSGTDSSKSALRALGDDIQLVLERFSGDVSLSPLRERMNKIISSIQTDPEVKSFFNQWKSLLQETITAPEDKDPAHIDAKFQELSKQGRVLLKKPEYRSDYNFCLSETRQFLGRVKEDTHVQKIGTDVESLRKEIMLNEKGQLDFGQVRSSLPALKNVLIPALTSALKSIPVPPIRTDDEKYLLEVTNLSLAAQDLVPENLVLHMANDLFFDFSGSSNDRFDSALSVAMNDFHANLRDLKFHYERKKMPRMTDNGIADIEIAGMTLKLRWLMEKDNEKLTFTCDKVRCRINQFNTTVKEAEHKILDKIALKLFNSQIKRGIEMSTEKALKEKLERFTIDTSSNVPLKEQIKVGGKNIADSISGSSSSVAPTQG